MKRTLLGIFLLQITLCLSGCMATPNDGIAVEMALQETQPVSKMEIPSTVYREANVLGIGSVAMDAVVMADTANVVGEVAVQRRAVGEEEVRYALGLLVKDGVPFYDHEEIKAELVEQLARFEEIATDAEWDQVVLQYLSSAIKEAPLLVEEKPFQWGDWDGESELWLRIRGEEEDAEVLLRPFGYLIKRKRFGDVMPSSWIDGSCSFRRETPAITPEEAMQQAVELLGKLGMANMSVLPEQVEECCAYHLARPVEFGYMITCEAKVGCLTNVWADDVFLSERAQPSVAAPWERERVTICIGPSGIWSIELTAACTYAEDEKGEPCLVPFETIVEGAEKQLNYLYAAWDYREPEKEAEVERIVLVKEVRLVRGTIQQMDAPQNGVNVPLWQFKYTLEEPGRAGEPHSIYINALNGAYVEPGIEYTELMELFN